MIARDKLQAGRLVLFNGKPHAVFEALDTDGNLVVSPIRQGEPLYRIRIYAAAHEYEVYSELDVVRPPKHKDKVYDEAGKLSDTLTYSEAGNKL